MTDFDTQAINHQEDGFTKAHSQATDETLSQTISDHTTPCGSVSNFHSDDVRRVADLLDSMIDGADSKKHGTCHCEPAIAAFTDPVKANSVLEKLEELHSKYETGSHSLRKETSTAIALRKHVNECLKINSVSCSASETGQISSSGTWSASVVKKPIVGRSLLGTPDSPSLKLTVELPLNDILSSIGPRFNAITDSGTKPNQSGDISSSFPRYLSGNQRGMRRKSLPVFYPRSTLYKATGEVSEDNAADEVTTRTKTLEESITDSYLASIGYLDSMPDGKLDWNKVSQLEQAIWMEQEDPKSSNFVRQGSLATYVRILKQSLTSCSAKRQQLVDEANEFYRNKQDELTSEQIQRMAHFRLYLNDAQLQITLVEKKLNQPNLFLISPDEVELMQQKRWPLVTPMRSRERYARQVRVVIEMLEIMNELLRSIKNPGDAADYNLFN